MADGNDEQLFYVDSLRFLSRGNRVVVAMGYTSSLSAVTPCDKIK